MKTFVNIILISAIVFGVYYAYNYSGKESIDIEFLLSKASEQSELSHEIESFFAYYAPSDSVSNVSGDYYLYRGKPISRGRQDFIEGIAKIIVPYGQKYKILPSLTIAQAILESGWGEASHMARANQLFGIKVHNGWTGSSVNMRTQEHDGVTYRTISDNFRAYDSYEQSIIDYYDYMINSSRYRAVIGELNYRKACNAVHKGGYATDPNYANALIRIIEEFSLYLYDGLSQKSLPPQTNQVEITPQPLFQESTQHPFITQTPTEPSTSSHQHVINDTSEVKASLTSDFQANLQSELRWNLWYLQDEQGYLTLETTQIPRVDSFEYGLRTLRLDSFLIEGGITIPVFINAIENASRATSGMTSDFQSEYQSDSHQYTEALSSLSGDFHGDSQSDLYWDVWYLFDELGNRTLETTRIPRGEYSVFKSVTLRLDSFVFEGENLIPEYMIA